MGINSAPKVAFVRVFMGQFLGGQEISLILRDKCSISAVGISLKNVSAAHILRALSSSMIPN